MTKKKLKIVLINIYKLTYNKEPEPFSIQFMNSTKETYNSEYIPLENKTLPMIVLYNLRNSGEKICIAAIQELAHHKAFTENADDTNSTLFIEIFKALLINAISLGYIQNEDVINSLEYKTVGLEEYEIIADYKSLYEINSNLVTLYIDNSDSRHTTSVFLASKGFTYSPIEKLWEYNTTTNVAEKMVEQLKEEISSLNILQIPFMTLKHNPIFRVCITGDTYKNRKMIMTRGYQYRPKEKKWMKLIHANEYENEQLFFQSIQNVNVFTVE